MKALFEIRQLQFSYKVGEPVLKNVSFDVQQGDFVAVTGPSGSGKSTLFYLLGALTEKFNGDIFFEDYNYRQMTPKQKSILRNQSIGFVFQQFHLLPRATVLENVLLPTYYPYDNSQPTEKDREQALQILNQLGLSEFTHRKPQELSGGQQQRVAIARALIRNPDVILADEPTGNLDSKSTADVMRIFKELHAQGKTIILITHSAEMASQCARILQFKDGQLESDTRQAPLRSTPSIIEPPLQDKTNTFPLTTYLHALKPSWHNIARTKAKSVLTMLGVILGVAAVLTTMSLGSYAKVKILDSYESLGVNTMRLFAYPNWRRSSKDFSLAVFKDLNWEKDALPMSRIFSEVELMSPFIRDWDSTFNYGGLSLKDKTATFGVNEQYFVISNQELALGRTISFVDIEKANPVCTLGANVKNKLFLSEDPLSKNVQINMGNENQSFPCRVIGIMKPQAAPPDSNMVPDNTIYMPYTYMQKNITNMWRRDINELRLKIRDGHDPDKTGQEIVGYFKSRYGTTGEFEAYSNAKVIQQMKLFLTVFSSLLTAVAIIALIVGGVGINNMMLVNLAERLKELGLRKSLGATPKQIRALVLTESILLCGLGGAIGLLCGFIGYQSLIFAATKLLPQIEYEWVFQPLAMLAASAAIVVTGILSGLVPAVRAERLEVIEALRQEQ